MGWTGEALGDGVRVGGVDWVGVLVVGPDGVLTGDLVGVVVETGDLVGVVFEGGDLVGVVVLGWILDLLALALFRIDVADLPTGTFPELPLI